MSMSQLQQTMATLRMTLAELQNKEQQLDALISQFRTQLQRLPRQVIYGRTPLDVSLSSMGEIEERLGDAEGTKRRLLAIKKTAMEELAALVLYLPAAEGQCLLNSLGQEAILDIDANSDGPSVQEWSLILGCLSGNSLLRWWLGDFDLATEEISVETQACLLERSTDITPSSLLAVPPHLGRDPRHYDVTFTVLDSVTGWSVRSCLNEQEASRIGFHQVEEARCLLDNVDSEGWVSRISFRDKSQQGTFEELLRNEAGECGELGENWLLGMMALEPVYCPTDRQSTAALAQDCETLLLIRDVLAGDAHLNWSRYIPITDWDGVRLTSFFETPRGIHELNLNGMGLNGIIPPELGRMTSLRASFQTAPRKS